MRARSQRDLWITFRHRWWALPNPVIDVPGGRGGGSRVLRVNVPTEWRRPAYDAPAKRTDTYRLGASVCAVSTPAVQ